jgi:hypothetical protein
MPEIKIASGIESGIGQNSSVLGYKINLSKTGFPSSRDIERLEQGVLYEKIWKGIFYDELGEKGAFMLKKYFESDISKKKILALSINIARTIITKTTRFFIGGDMVFSVDTKDDAKKNTLQEKVNEISKRSKFLSILRQEVNSFQVHGYSTMRVILENEKAKIESVPYDSAFPSFDINQQNNGFVIGRYFRILNGSSVATYMYIQQYSILGKVMIAHKLYKTNGWECTERVNFSVLGGAFSEFGGADGMGRIDISDTLTEIPVVQTNDMKVPGEYFSMGVIEQIKSACEEICDCLTRLSGQFIKHLSAKIAVPTSAVQPKINAITGEQYIPSTSMEVIPVTSGDIIPQYITNSNPLIEQQFVELEKLLHLIAAIAEVPKSFVGIEEKGGIETVGAKRLNMAEFLKKIEDYQQVFQDSISRLFVFALLLEKQDIPVDLCIKVKYREGLPRDKKNEIGIHSEAVSNGLSSKNRAIQDFFGLTKEEAEKELEEILKEDSIGANFNPITI